LLWFGTGRKRPYQSVVFGNTGVTRSRNGKSLPSLREPITGVLRVHAKVNVIV
jgi:hypothetical protein